MMSGLKPPESPIEFRSISKEDELFLLDLYTSTREEEMSLVPWSDEEKRTFLKQQFKAQHSFYLQQFQKARFEILLLEGKRIGRLYVDRRPDEIRIIDIALLPGYRNRGIGSMLMNSLFEEAFEERKPVRIHVEKNNPALHLYRRLGFQEKEDKGVYFLMERKHPGLND